ncbi:hypothetical protein E2C01_047094 [Portunus trituberculatus]|uniref:Uncharacterized protein n=1 Tax=Portunus trituberculatus TaxID=210409 RepID=A0A5B7G6T8_PORTR|nr:hypothetical protein [Portunus trituberculatus]
MYGGHSDLPVTPPLFNSVTRLKIQIRRAVDTGRLTYDLGHTPGRGQSHTVQSELWQATSASAVFGTTTWDVRIIAEQLKLNV